MKGRQAAIALGVFLGAAATQGLWAADDDNRAVPRDSGSSGQSSGGGASYSGPVGNSGGDSSTYSGPSFSFASDDNRAVPRGGGSSGGGHSSGGSSAGAHRSGGSSGGSSGSSVSGHNDSGSSRGASVRTPRTDAQRRHPQPGTGTGYRHYRGGRYYGGGYYPYGRSYYPYDDYYWGYGYFFSPWYYPRYYGGYYGGGYYGGYGYGSPYYHRAYYDRSGSVRVLVEPRETKVYVDDYYAGVADDFDGIFQRLNLTPGRHDLSLQLEGFETLKVKLYVPLDHTIKIKHQMVRGASDNVTEQTIGDPADGERYARRADDEDDDRAYDRDRRRDDDRYDSRDDRRDDSWPARAERGTLRLDVTPSDASIYVDGMFRGTGQDLRRLTLPAGRHRLEVVRPGYRTLERDVEVQAGESEDVEVELPRS